MKMLSKTDLVRLFFHDLKKYNFTNFKTLVRSDLSTDNATVHKAFSAVITRYFIFCEKHDELSDSEKRMLFFQIKLDMIARYFSNYPETNMDELKAFQLELRNYVAETKEEMENAVTSTI